ncbi:MAG TPA: hypothetical protein VFR31_17455 [Thermoanaerobaculia bacterium]|nr:hypothetical protein [Thermoanaerobaculia bacterium]
MKSLPISLALILLLSAHSASARKVDANQLLRLAAAGLADIDKAASASQGKIDRAKPEQRPFWRAVDKMDAALRRVNAGMEARDPSFFTALESGSAALGELRVVWVRTAVPDPGVSEALRILSKSYELLRTGYGREAVRHRKGGGLTEAERQRFLRIQQAQRRFADLLRELEAAARRRHDEAMLAELRRMAEEAERIAAAQLTLDAYLNALMIGDSQAGEWEGNSQYAVPADYTEWEEAEVAVEELQTEQEIGHVFVLDLGNLNAPAAPAASQPSTLTHFEEETELPDSLASEIVEFDAIEEEEAFYEEEMEEEADTDLEAIEEIVEEEEAEGEEEVVEELVLEGLPVVEEGKDGEVTGEVKKVEEKTEAKPAEAKKEEAVPAPPVKKDSKKTDSKKESRPPAPAEID